MTSSRQKRSTLAMLAKAPAQLRKKADSVSAAMPIRPGLTAETEIGALEDAEDGSQRHEQVLDETNR
jgi:hypothetical protein